MQSKAKKHEINHRQRVIFTILVLFIPLANFAIFILGMNGEMFVNSFFMNKTMTDGTTVNAFVGFHNYAVLFRNLSDFTGEEAISFVVLRNTLMVIPISVFTTCLSLIMSYAIARKFLGHRFFRIVLYAPCILSTVILCMIFRYMCLEGGIIYELFGKNIKGGQGLFGDDVVWYLVVAYSIWTGGVINLYFMSAFSRLPQSVIESAQLDGASETTLFFKIAFPLVSSLFVTMLLSSICGAFGFFAPVYFLTNASQKSAHTIGYILITFAQGNTGAADGRVGLFAALGVVITIIGSIIAVFTRWLGSKLAVEDVEY